MCAKSSKSSAMSWEVEASMLVKRIAEPRLVDDSVKVAILRAAHRLGWKPSRTREIWYGRAHRIDAPEMDSLRELAAKGAARYEAIAQAMERTNEAFYREDIAALVNAARRLGGENLPGTRARKPEFRIMKLGCEMVRRIPRARRRSARAAIDRASRR